MRFRWFKVLFVELPVVLFTGWFVYVVLHLLPTPPAEMALFEAYYQGQLAYYWVPLGTYVLFVFLYLLSGMNIATKYAHPGKSNLTFRTIRYAFSLAAIVLVSVPLSFFVTYLFAFFQVNSAILAYNYGSADKEIKTAPQAVADEITFTEKLDIVLMPKKNYKKTILLYSIKKPEGMYKDRFLAGFPDVLYQRSYLPYSSMYVVNNTLVLFELSRQELGIISPALGRVMVEHSLKNIHKPLPDIEVMTKSDYIAFRNKYIERQVGTMDDVVEDVDSHIATVSGYIDTINQSLAKNQALKESELAKKEALKCKKPETCEAAKKRLDRNIEIAENNIAKATAALEKNQAVLGTTVENKESILTVRNSLAATEQFTDDEMGVFIPGNKIKMTLDERPERLFDAYIATLVHEYFHYLSYSADGQLDPFFEEGLTEYFTRFAIKEYTGTDALELGYPMGYRIIKAMTKDIPPKELVGVYFSKDQQALEQLLANTYGKTFYTRNIESLHKLSYLPFEQGLMTANIILKDMNASPLTKQDFIQH